MCTVTKESRSPSGPVRRPVAPYTRGKRASEAPLGGAPWKWAACKPRILRMCPVSSNRAPLRLLVRDDHLSGASGSEVPLPHRHLIGQSHHSPRYPLLARGTELRPGPTTTPPASLATIA